MRKYVWETPEEINMEVAKRMKTLRKRVFEETGNISLLSLTKMAIALDAEGDIKKLFSEVPYRSIQEVINEQK